MVVVDRCCPAIARASCVAIRPRIRPSPGTWLVRSTSLTDHLVECSADSLDVQSAPDHPVTIEAATKGQRPGRVLCYISKQKAELVGSQPNCLRLVRPPGTSALRRGVSTTAEDLTQATGENALRGDGEGC
jgi:hypothetical protein